MLKIILSVLVLRTDLGHPEEPGIERIPSYSLPKCSSPSRSQRSLGRRHLRIDLNFFKKLKTLPLFIYFVLKKNVTSKIHEGNTFASSLDLVSIDIFTSYKQSLPIQYMVQYMYTYFTDINNKPGWVIPVINCGISPSLHTQFGSPSSSPFDLPSPSESILQRDSLQIFIKVEE